MPKAVTFEPGARYILNGNGYQVLLTLHDGTVVVRDLTNNALVAHQRTALWCSWQKNTLEFVREGPNLQTREESPLKTTYAFGDLAHLPPQLQSIAWHHYQLIRPLIPLSSRQRTKKVIEERIQTYLSSLEQETEESMPGKQAFLASLVQEEVSSPTQEASGDHAVPLLERDEHSPSPQRRTQHFCYTLSSRTVSRWIQRYLESKEDIRSLVPSYHQRGPQHSFLKPPLETLLQQAIRQTYLTNHRAPVTHVIATLEAFILAENANHPSKEPLVMPGPMTVYRYINNQLDAKEVDRARKGPRQAERDHHQAQQGPVTHRPNQRTEFDFTVLDTLVVDENDRLPLGRPTIAALRDKFTGYILGIIISFEPPSYRLVMECMLYAFLPKDHVKRLFQTQHEYLAFGIPEVLVVDNGIELHRDLELACLQLGIELQHMPVRTPWFKGSIERWFRTLNTDLIHATPGTTFSNFLQRGEYQSQKHACITLDRLWELLHLWIVDIYTQEVHQGVGGHPRNKGIPAQLWQQALEEHFVPRLPPSRNELVVLISRTTTRTIHHSGIEFENLLYQDHQLSALRSKLAKAKKYRTTQNQADQQKEEALQNNLLSIKYHPGDLSRIWVLDPFSNRYLEVAAVDQDYTTNLSLWKHRVIKRFAHEELKRQIDHEALILAKARIQQIITDEMRLTKKIHTRQGMARWWNQQVTTWINDSISPHTDHSSNALPSHQREDHENVQPEVHLVITQDTSTSKEASMVDLSAPLPQLDPQVTLLPGSTGQENADPFVPFPSLPASTNAPRERKRRKSGQTHTTANTPLQDQQTSPQPQEGQARSAASHQMASTIEPPSTDSLTKTSSLAERQRSFGIEVSHWRR